MPDRDVILAKVSNIQRCLKRIKEVTTLNPESLNNIDTQDIFILNLQRAIESTIDIAIHIVASEGLGLSTTVKDNFRLLKKADIINDNLLRKMESMVGFRNIAIHDYKELDVEILKSILSKNIKDLEEFYSTIIDRFSL